MKELPLAIAMPPGLAALGLSAEELNALTTQGFVCADHRAGGGTYHKLRFRVRGRQVVRYLGANSQRAEAVRLELLSLQAQETAARELKRLMTEANMVLRQTKVMVEGKLKNEGFAFHGFAIRASARSGE